MKIERRIVPMEEKHLPTLALLERKCFSSPWSENALREELENPQAAFLVAEQGGEVFGYLGLQIIAGEGNITNVAVFPEVRRQGVATDLLRAALRLARARCLTFVTLEVRASHTDTIRLYRSQGFQPQGVRPGFYAQPREDALIMTCFLEKGTDQIETVSN